MTFLFCIVIAIVQMKDLFAVVMLTGVYGLLSASLFVTMDAVDVAITEAAVGAGIATLLMVTAIAKTGRYDNVVRHKPALALVVVFITGGLLIYGTLDMPYFGSATAPGHQHVVPRYINDSMQETGVKNIVTSVLASYRGFDTFGEVVVIFTAGVGVLSLLSVAHRPGKKSSTDSMQQQYLILRIVTKMLIPFILLFALYVQFHGDFGPGGGFQAGVIFASAIILYALLFGYSEAHRVINQSLIRLLSATGVLLFGGVGVASLLNGGNFLDYSVFSADPVAGQHMGIFLVELGIGCTVTAVMIIIFFNFSCRDNNSHINENKAV